MFDTDDYRKTKLLPNDNYLGKDNFRVDSLQWRWAKNGQSVFDKDDERAFQAIIVGDIGDYRLNAGPTGNYISPEFGSLAKAKYQIHVSPPITSPFREDYDKSFSVLKNLQDIAAATNKRADMLYEESGGKTIRMTRNIFEKRKRPARDSPQPKAAKKMKMEKQTESDETEEMDDETNNWIVPSGHQDEMDMLKTAYRAVPLRVYKDRKFVEPPDVQDNLENTLAEIRFTINHTYIKRGKEPHDSFQAEIDEIAILKKRQIPVDQASNPRAGPSEIRKRPRQGPSKSGADSKGKETTRPGPSEAGPSRS